MLASNRHIIKTCACVGVWQCVYGWGILYSAYYMWLLEGCLNTCSYSSVLQTPETHMDNMWDFPLGGHNLW